MRRGGCCSSVLAPIAVTGNTGLIPQGVGGEYYTLSAVAAEVQVKATVVTKDHLKAITAPREFSSPATGSQADNLFDIQDANPPFVVTPQELRRTRARDSSLPNGKYSRRTMPTRSTKRRPGTTKTFARLTLDWAETLTTTCLS